MNESMTVCMYVCIVKHEGQLDIFEMQVPVVDSSISTSTRTSY
jgi:hypothetical protein